MNSRRLGRLGEVALVRQKHSLGLSSLTSSPDRCMSPYNWEHEGGVEWKGPKDLNLGFSVFWVRTHPLPGLLYPPCRSHPTSRSGVFLTVATLQPEARPSRPVQGPAERTHQGSGSKG